MLRPSVIELAALREHHIARLSPPGRQHLQVATQLRCQRRGGVIVQTACQRQIVVGVEYMKLLHKHKGTKNELNGKKEPINSFYTSVERGMYEYENLLSVLGLD